MIIRKAEFADLNIIVNIFKDAIKIMNENNIQHRDEVQSIRLDAFSQNPYALKMHETLGYKYDETKIVYKGEEVHEF